MDCQTRDMMLLYTIEHQIRDSIAQGMNYCFVMLFDTEITIHSIGSAQIACGIESPYTNLEVKKIISSLKGWDYYREN